MKIKYYILWNYRVFFLIIGLVLQILCKSQELNPRNIEYIFSDASPAFRIKLNYQILTDSIKNEFIAPLQKQFYERGYLGFSIDSFQIKKQTLYIYIYSGKKYKLKSITLANSEFETLSKKFVFARNLSPKKLNSIDQTYYRKIQDLGYPYALLNKQINIRESHLAIHYHVDKKQLVTFDSLQSSPENLISNNYLQQITGIKPNEPYNYSIIKHIKRNVTQGGIFKVDTVYSTIYGLKSQNTLKLKTIKSNSFSALIGIQPDKGKTTEITGQANIELANAFKKGESIEINWQKPASLSQQLNTSFNIPYIFNSNIGIQFYGYIDKKDSSFTNTQITPGVFIPAIGYGKFIVSLKITNSIVNQTNTEILTSSKALQYGLGYQYTNFDDPFNPKKGLDISSTIYTGNNEQKMKNATNYKSTLIEWLGNFNFATPLPIGSIFLKNTWAIMVNDSLKLNNLYQLGGNKTMRGFNEKSIFAKQYVYGNYEYRLHLNSDSYLYVLYDLGLFIEPTQNTHQTLTRQAVGAGLNITTGSGNLSISYALGKTSKGAFLINQGKIHIGYQNRF